jgi:hypothetical protein
MGFLAGTAASLIGKGIGSLFGGLSKSGDQGGATKTSSSTSNQTLSGTDTSSGLQHNIEDADFAGLRSSLIPMMTQELNKAQEPVYGDAQKGQFMSGLNDLTNSSVKSLSSSLAARGISDSGAAAEGYSGIESQRLGKASDFYSQLPFQEAQARSAKVNSLLGMATGWTGSAPVDVQTTGSQTTNRTGTTTTEGTETVKNQGKPWWKTLLGDVSAGMGGGGGLGGGLMDIFKGSNKGTWV